jgi:hypothetical protein
VLNSLKNEFHYAFDDSDTLLPKIKKICDYINFDEKEKLVSIIRYRNNILHEASRDFPSGRYDFLEYCQTYNLFVSALLAKFPGFSVLYKIDESIFNIDLTVVNEDQKAKQFSATA